MAFRRGIAGFCPPGRIAGKNNLSGQTRQGRALERQSTKRSLKNDRSFDSLILMTRHRRQKTTVWLKIDEISEAATRKYLLFARRYDVVLSLRRLPARALGESN